MRLPLVPDSQHGQLIAVACRAADLVVQAAAVGDSAVQRGWPGLARRIAGVDGHQIRGEVGGLPARFDGVGREQSRHAGLWSNRARVEQPALDPLPAQARADAA